MGTTHRARFASESRVMARLAPTITTHEVFADGARRAPRQLIKNSPIRSSITVLNRGVSASSPPTPDTDATCVIQAALWLSSRLFTDFRQGPDQGHPAPAPPRWKVGTATGFSVVDVGGNRLRFYRHGSSDDDSAERRSGLLRVIDVAARQGDSRGDDAQAIAVLEAGLARYPCAPPIEVFEARLYRAELRARTGAVSAPDLAAARALLTEHQLGAEAEQALVLAVEADLTTEEQIEIGGLGEDASVPHEY
jgi:hypothetical protein